MKISNYLVLLIMLLTISFIVVKIYKNEKKVFPRKLLIVIFTILIVFGICIQNNTVNKFIKVYLFSDKVYTASYNEEEINIKLPPHSSKRYKDPTEYYYSSTSIAECKGFFLHSLNQMKSDGDIKNLIFNEADKSFFVIFNKEFGIKIRLLTEENYRFAIADLESLIVKDAYVYFKDEDDEIYKIQMNTGEKLQLTNFAKHKQYVNENFNLLINENNLFYISSNGRSDEAEDYLYKINLDTLEKRKVIDAPIEYTDVYDGHIYYLSFNNYLNRFSLKKNKIEKLFKLADSRQIYISDGYIIYEKTNKDTQENETSKVKISELK